MSPSPSHHAALGAEREPTVYMSRTEFRYLWLPPVVYLALSPHNSISLPTSLLTQKAEIRGEESRKPHGHVFRKYCSQRKLLPPKTPL